MDTLWDRFGDKVNGVIEGADRMVFKGILKPISYAKGMGDHLYHNGVLLKDCEKYWRARTNEIVGNAAAYSRNACGQDIIPISSCNTRKEELAHRNQELLDIRSGLIGVWSCVETGTTFKSAFNSSAPYPEIVSRRSRCKHLYFYYDHEDYGFMSIRLQTWAPFEIQIAINGREWLRRQLGKSGVGHVVSGNKFLQIDDYAMAQELLSGQSSVMWTEVLPGFLPAVFPSMCSTVGDMTYTWTMWQNEWARDYIFSDPSRLREFMRGLVRHAFLCGNGDRVLKYMAKPVRLNGQPYSDPELMTRLNTWSDGARIRHWVNGNSIKMYDESNVLRIEFTMNRPGRHRVWRPKEGDPGGVKKYLPIRKGVADTHVRSIVCSQRVQCFAEHMAALTSEMTVGEVMSRVTEPVFIGSKRYRALEPVGKDLLLLQALGDPENDVTPITNARLRGALADTPWANGLKDGRLSARVSRHLRLLREHGLIRKGQKRTYELTAKGRLLTTALNQLLSVKISDLSKLAG